MAIVIARETSLDLGLEVRFVLEYFVSLPKPYVRLIGAAANAAGRPLANLVELSASNYHYKVLVELPRVQFCDNEIEWSVDHNSEVTIEGQISSAAIFADKPITGNKRNRVQLCPTEPWAISFYLPGPVDWWTTSVIFTSDNFMEILVMKSNPEDENSASGSTVFVPAAESSATGSTTFLSVAEASASGATTSVPVAETSTASSTAFVSGANLSPRPEDDDTSLTPSELMDMVDGWFE